MIDEGRHDEAPVDQPAAAAIGPAVADICESVRRSSNMTTSIHSMEAAGVIESFLKQK
jgi:hypothetical protein